MHGARASIIGAPVSLGDASSGSVFGLCDLFNDIGVSTFAAHAAVAAHGSTSLDLLSGRALALATDFIGTAVAALALATFMKDAAAFEVNGRGLASEAEDSGKDGEREEGCSHSDVVSV